MGHYASEMISDEEAEEKAARVKQARDRMARRIKRAIEKEGIEYVLADILSDPDMMHIHFS